MSRSRLVVVHSKPLVGSCGSWLIWLIQKFIATGRCLFCEYTNLYDAFVSLVYHIYRNWFASLLVPVSKYLVLQCLGPKISSIYVYVSYFIGYLHFGMIGYHGLLGLGHCEFEPAKRGGTAELDGTNWAPVIHYEQSIWQNQYDNINMTISICQYLDDQSIC